ncbi:Protein of unknown function [Lactobacillus helveticus CIRM-BIA 103]|nr:Protein of unknown function [Lactobacillus helveticus CIRM-BIA 103]
MKVNLNGSTHYEKSATQN